MGGIFLCVNALISMSVYGALGFIDIALVGGLTLGIYFKKSRACATILLILFVVSNAVGAYLMPIDFLSVILLVVISFALVCGMLGTFAFQKEWKAYRDKKTLPPEE